MTQSGFQVIYGGGSASEAMKSLEEESKESASSDESMGYAPLVALALLAVLGGIAFSVIAVYRGGERANLLSSVLPISALVLLLIQLMLGFPAKKHVFESMAEGSSKTKVEESALDDSMDRSMEAAMMMSVRVKMTPAFYLELLALGIPMLLLVNKYKKGSADSSTTSIK